MNRRPWELWALAGFYAGTTLSLPLQVMAQYGHAPWEFWAVVTKLAPMNFAVMALGFACSWAAVAASRWILALAPAFLAVVAWNNWLFTAVDANVSGLAASIATLVAFAGQVPLLRPSPIHLLRDPSNRWWLTAPRRRLRLLTLLSPVSGGDLRARAYDVSATGAYFALEDARWTQPGGSPVHPTQVGLAPGTRCTLRLTLDQGRTILCAAQVVRSGAARGHYPGGFAVQFLDLARGDRRSLERLIQLRGEPHPA
ncbi:MAG: PilZ domain-containing protein [Bdellovibrionales bacterium]|nr:PilZ domain-containing protein [Bdellovibrionales bacterium]